MVGITSSEEVEEVRVRNGLKICRTLTDVRTRLIKRGSSEYN